MSHYPGYLQGKTNNIWMRKTIECMITFTISVVGLRLVNLVGVLNESMSESHLRGWPCHKFEKYLPLESYFRILTSIYCKSFTNLGF